MTVIPDARRRAIGAIGITGTSGVWTNVTPAAIAAQLTNPDYGATGDNSGVQDVLADPSAPNVFYAFACYFGCWKSTDYGATWIQVSTVGGPLDLGKPWGESIAPDGSYLLATCGQNFTQYGGVDGRRQVFKSTDGGVTWTAKGDTGRDPYNVSICPFDKTKVIGGAHDDDTVLYSADSGETWAATAMNGGSGNSAYVDWLHDASTAIFVFEAGAAPAFRLTRSGSTWTPTSITDLVNAGHAHGVYHLYYDVANSAFYHPSAAATGGDGIWKSTNNGVNWTQVYSTSGECSIVATATTLYAGRSFPSGQLAHDPKLTTAARVPGTSWAAPNNTPGMQNGPKRQAVQTDGVRFAIVSGNWNGGLWRYIE